MLWRGCLCAAEYSDGTDDVLKARLKTVGVSEYRFEMEAGSEQGTQWRIIDVGGSRSQVRVPVYISASACSRVVCVLPLCAQRRESFQTLGCSVGTMLMASVWAIERNMGPILR